MAKVLHLPRFFLSPASLPPWPDVPGTLSPRPPRQEAAAAPPQPAGSPPQPPRAPRGAARGSRGARASVACSAARATGKQWGRAAQGVPPLGRPVPTPAQKGPGRTYRAPKLARNSFSARKLPACSPAAHGARPAPAQPGPARPRRPSAAGCLRLGLQQLLLTARRPQGRSDGGSQRGGDPLPCVPYPRPFPGCCTAGNGDRRRTARSRSRSQPSPRRRLGFGS